MTESDEDIIAGFPTESYGKSSQRMTAYKLILEGVLLADLIEYSFAKIF